MKSKASLPPILLILVLGLACNFGRYDLYAIYDDVDGLSEGDKVYVSGLEIGKVAGLDLQPNGKVIARLSIDPERRIPHGSRFYLDTRNLLGTMAVDIRLGRSDRFHTPGDTVRGYAEKNLIEEYIFDTDSAAYSVDKVKQGVKELFGSPE